MATKSTLKREADGTIKITLTIPADQIKKVWDEEVENTVKNAEMEGFRKGKAPKEMVEKRIDKSKIKEEILRKLLPQIYSDAIKDHQLKPIISPKIRLEEMEEDKDWTCVAVICETPEVKLNNYKDAIGKVTAKTKIIVPGKEKKEITMEEIMKPLLETATVNIPSILSDGEIERLLSQLLDEIKQLGLTLEQYLASTGKTVEQLRNDYRQKAENDIKLEFILQKVAETENISVEQSEIDEAILKAKDEREKEHLKNNMYVLASILRQQKTLDFLKSL